MRIINLGNKSAFRFWVQSRVAELWRVGKKSKNCHYSATVGRNRIPRALLLLRLFPLQDLRRLLIVLGHRFLRYGEFVIFWNFWIFKKSQTRHISGTDDPKLSKSTLKPAMEKVRGIKVPSEFGYNQQLQSNGNFLISCQLSITLQPLTAPKIWGHFYYLNW